MRTLRDDPMTAPQFSASPPPWDTRLLFITRAVRLFAYGSISLILVLYLVALGYREDRIGVLLTMTLLGDTLLSLLITTVADRAGRKRMLIAGALLMVFGGLVFALTEGFLPLLFAATIGVISPTGNEVGPFLAIEQAALAQTVSAKRRTRLFAWYNLTGSYATAAGALVTGTLVQFLIGQGLSVIQSYRAVLLGYAVAGIVLMVLFSRLSQGLEAVPASWGATRPKAIFGLHRSRGVILTLSALFALDAFAGGFVLQSIIAYWFQLRFGAEPATLGAILFGANLLAGFSALAAAALARRIGLLPTMVFTHVPSNLLLIILPFSPTLPFAIAVLLLRFSISQMDVPTRQSYIAAVVAADERSAAAGVTGVARTTGAALSPTLAGLFLASPLLAGMPFVLAGLLKILYDGLLFFLLRNVPVPEESPASQGGGK
jgi:MFS family permease